MDYMLDDVDTWYNLKRPTDVSNNNLSDIDNNREIPCIGVLNTMPKVSLLTFLREIEILDSESTMSDAVRWLSIENALHRRNTRENGIKSKKNN